ncbi:MAG: hybrid sensor histidine kinase/response regulator [Arcobacteraceae bacterium]
MHQKETILIVDDTLTNIDILVRLLDKYDLVVATSGKEALNILNDGENIDLILLDIMMPEMDGFEVCQILKNDVKFKRIPIIFLTAKFDDTSIQNGFEMGAVDYIIKPFRPIELLSRIKTHLQIVDHEKKLIENNKNIAIAELIHNIAHQWRQPLSVISTASSAIVLEKEMNMLTDDTLFDYCDKITHSTEYLSTIINNISNIIEDTEESTKINIKTLIDRNFVLFFGNTKHNVTHVSLSIDDDIIFFGNRSKFIQILLAIITNSKDAFLERSLDQLLLFINATIENNQCKLELYDNTGGISLDVIDRIFEPYFTTKYKSQGRGLGLYLVKKTIQELFGGSISVSNFEYVYDQTEQKGVKFEIFLPVL